MKAGADANTDADADGIRTKYTPTLRDEGT